MSKALLVKPSCGPETRIAWLLGVLVLMGIFAVLVIAARVFVPIVMAVFVAAVLRAPVRSLIGFGIPRFLAAILVFIAVGAVAVSLSYMLSAPAAKWIDSFPKVVERVESAMTPIRKSLQQANETAEKFESVANLGKNRTRSVALEHPPLIYKLFRQSGVLVVQTGAVFVLAFFMLATSKPLLPNRVIARLNGHGRRLKLSIRQIEQQVSRYMGLAAVVNLCVGVLTGIAMHFFGMPNPVLWGAVAAIFAFVPYVGPLTTTAIIAGAAFLTFQHWQDIVLPPLVYFSLHVIESEFVSPLLQGKFLTLHPVAIMISVVIWGWMWGLAGVFLAVPMLVAFTIITRNLLIHEEPSHRPVALNAPDVKRVAG